MIIMFRLLETCRLPFDDRTGIRCDQRRVTRRIGIVFQSLATPCSCRRGPFRASCSLHFTRLKRCQETRMYLIAPNSVFSKCSTGKAPFDLELLVLSIGGYESRFHSGWMRYNFSPPHAFEWSPVSQSELFNWHYTYKKGKSA